MADIKLFSIYGGVQEIKLSFVALGKMQTLMEKNSLRIINQNSLGR